MHLSRRCRVASTRLFFLLLTLPGPGWAQSAADPSPAPSAPVTASAPAPEDDDGLDQNAPARFGIRLEAPDALQAFLLRHLDLQRYRSLSDLDTSELDSLLHAAPDNLRDLLGTQGYFSPQITISRERVATTANGTPAPALGEVRIQVDPGPLTRVATAETYFRGDIAQAPATDAQREAIRHSAQQAVGKTFTQAAWDKAKSDALRQLTAEHYPRGRIANSLSDIDAQGHAAHWHIELDSGAPVRLGEVRVEGAERYGTTTVERLAHLAGLQPGADYSLAKLQAAQQKIADSGYYTSVFAYADLGGADAPTDAAVPVVVQVKEAQLQSVVLGIGGSTNNGPRISAEHTHLRLPGIGWQAHSKLQLERNDQLLSSDWGAPVEEDGWHWLAGGRLAREINGTATTSSLRLSLGKAQNSDEVDRRYYLQYDRARTVDTGVTDDSSDGNDAAVSANYGWTWRNFDTLPYPNSGYGLGLTVGAGTTLGSVRKPFATTQVRWLGYWPLGKLSEPGRPEDGEQSATVLRSHLGRLALRLQGGAVLANASAPIPDSLLFLTGGDNTVRGYGLRDIGVEQADGSVKPGRYLAVASFEWQRPITSSGVRTAWESVVFVDAGAVTDSNNHLDASRERSGLKPKVGVGVGARYNSPVGPLQIDLAYGVDTKRFRVHLNVGFSF